MRWQSTETCALCGKKASCLWETTSPFCGRWVCHACEQSPNDQLSDLVKTLSKPQSEVVAAGSIGGQTEAVNPFH